jgi:uncharacterized protein (DUF486 family)
LLETFFPCPLLSMKSIYTVLLLTISNLFMTFAWYGHLQFKKITWLHGLGLVGVILISWGLAFFEYVFQVPANRIGFEENGGPFNLFQLKVIQEVISLSVFTLCAPTSWAGTTSSASACSLPPSTSFSRSGEVNPESRRQTQLLSPAACPVGRAELRLGFLY